MSQATTPPSEPGKPMSPWAPFAHRAFTMLFIAQFISNVGTWMHTVGAQWYLVEETGSPALVAAVNTATTLPVIFLSLLAGVAADLINRKWLLLWTTVAAMAVAAFLTFLTFVGELNALLLLGLTLLLGATAATIGPAWQAIQPELVNRDELPVAASLATVTVNGARAVGPAIAGVIVATQGPAYVFALNTLSFGAVAVALLLWKRERVENVNHERLWAAVVMSARYVRSAPSVQRILLRTFLYTLPASALWALLPVAANTLLGAGADGYSLLLALIGAGAVSGVLVVPWMRERIHPTWLSVIAYSAFAVGNLGAALLPFAGAAAGAFIAGIGWILALTQVNAGMQLVLPGWIRARGMSVYLLVFMGTQAVGSLLWGVVSEFVGVQATLLLTAGLLFAAGLAAFLLPLPATIGTLDRTQAPLAGDGTSWTYDPAQRDQAVQVQIDYVVPLTDTEDFTSAMSRVRAARQRTGAYGWRLLDVTETESTRTYREVFRTASHREHELQHTLRWTGSDDALVRAARAFATEPVRVAHMPVRL